MDAKRWAWLAGLWTTVIIACFLIIGATDAWLRYDIAVRDAVTEAELTRADVTARRAQDLAQHDRAMVTAVCEAFHQRDVEDANHAKIVTRNLQAYFKSLNVLQRVNDPEAVRHAKVLAQIAYSSNCGRLMEAAINKR